MTITAAPTYSSFELAREVITARGVVLVDDRTTADGWVFSPTGHDTATTRNATGHWQVSCARCGTDIGTPWVSPLGALDAAAGHAARP